MDYIETHVNIGQTNIAHGPRFKPFGHGCTGIESAYVEFYPLYVKRVYYNLARKCKSTEIKRNCDVVLV